MLSKQRVAPGGKRTIRREDSLRWRNRHCPRRVCPAYCGACHESAAFPSPTPIRNSCHRPHRVRGRRRRPDRDLDDRSGSGAERQPAHGCAQGQGLLLKLKPARTNGLPYLGVGLATRCLNEGTPFNPRSATWSRLPAIVRQVEKLASVCQADPRVAHSDVVLALLLPVCLLRERRAAGRDAPRVLRFCPRGVLGFGSYRPSSLWTAPDLPRYPSRHGCLSAARLSRGYFLHQRPRPNCSPVRLISVTRNGTNGRLLVLHVNRVWSCRATSFI